MVASGSVLKRYALAYIKKSGGSNNIEEFLQHCGKTSNLTWSEDKFAEVYKEFIKSQNLNNRENRENERNVYNESNVDQPTVTQTTHIHVHNKGLDLWDYLLLQCCFDSLFGGRSHTTVVHNYGNTTNQGREDKKKRLGR